MTNKHGARVGAFSFGQDGSLCFHEGTTDLKSLCDTLNEGLTGGPYRAEFAYIGSHPLDALLPEICQLIDGVKAEWSQQGCWSEWDESVRSRIAEYNISRRLAGSAVTYGVGVGRHQVPSEEVPDGPPAP